MPGPWLVKTQEYLLERWWMRLRRDHVVLPNGVELEEYHVLEMPDWVCIICPVKSHVGEPAIVLVRQFRHAVDRVSLELPAGAIEPDESVLDAAQRELVEETGYRAENFVPMGKLYADPSRITNAGHIVVAQGAVQVEDPKPDPSEELEVVVVPIRELDGLIASGELAHATHVAAILKATSDGLISVD